MKFQSQRGQVVMFVLIAIAAIVIVWVLSWILVPVQMTSPGNVMKQWAFAYGYDEALQNAARKVCAAQRAVEGTSGDVQTQRQSQEIALEMNYSSIEAKYNAALRNAFEAKYIRPSDVPSHAPTLDEMRPRVCGK